MMRAFDVRPASCWHRGAISGDGNSEIQDGYVALAGRNLWLLGIWLELLKKIPFQDHFEEFADELTNAHVPELCLER